MYELQQIRLFLKVVECSSLNKAAESLNMTQPGLSRSMRRLEEELGVSLFSRTKNSIELNENGKKALELFSELYKKALETEESIRKFAESKKIVTVLSPSPTLFGEIVRRFSISNPELKIVTELSSYDKMVNRLRSENCQMIQVSNPVAGDDVYNAVFDEESLYLLLPKNHRLSSKKEGVFLSELDGETILSLSETGYWNRVTKKLLPNSRFIYQKEQTDFETLLCASNLPTFVTDSMIASLKDLQARTIIPLLDDYLNVTVYCCCLSKNRPFFEKFFSLYSS